MTKKTAKAIREELETRLAIILPWYDDCDICQETLDNVRKDVNSVFNEIMRRHKIDDPSFRLRTRFEGTLIVVDVIDRKLN